MARLIHMNELLKIKYNWDMAINDDLGSFVEKERERFENRENNMFALSFSVIIKYREFLQIIVDRYKALSEEYVKSSDELFESLRNIKGPMTPELWEMHEKQAQLSRKLHLEIESFYQFAKVLLDRIVHAIEYYFGPLRGCAMDSHDNWAKRFDKYCKEKNLNTNEGLSVSIAKLKIKISDVRDYKFTHQKSPRASHGTWHSQGKVGISVGWTFPKDSDEYFQSPPIDEILEEIDHYLRNIIEFIELNGSRSALKTLVRVEGT